MLKLGSIPAISNQDDGIVLKTLALSAVLILLLLFFLVPSSVPPVPVPIQPTAPPMSPALRSGVPCRVVMVPVQPKTLGLSDIPSCPPFVETTVPTPCPTPAGGGILRKIVFASNRADGRYYQLYMMDADGQDLERLTESKAFDRDPHFSYDGKLLAFSIQSRKRDLSDLRDGPRDPGHPAVDLESGGQDQPVLEPGRPQDPLHIASQQHHRAGHYERGRQRGASDREYRRR